MENKNDIKFFIIISVVIIAFVFGLIYINNYKKGKDEYENYLRDYKVNEYIPANISDETMAKTYLADFTNLMLNDIRKAYNMLDEKYRSEKFGNFNSFETYVNNLSSSFILSKYYKYNKDGYLIFGVYDNNDNLYIFKTKGVMQYSVYLDDYTVEIGD